MKSTIGGSLLLNAIQQNNKVCAYSGELPADKFLEWILCQATEAKYIEAKTDERTGKEYAVVPYNIQSRIREWIDEKFFLFDNNYSPDIPQEEAIINIFTSCARQYGAKLFLVDNLLTILSDANGADENRIQAKFVAALKSFAVKYKASVMLVAHPRKSQKGEVFTSESVAGSGNITNLADVVMSIEKPNIRITKNREFGITNLITCDYNPANRRIFEHQYGDNIVYGWNHDDIEVPENQAINSGNFEIQCGLPEELQQPF